MHFGAYSCDRIMITSLPRHYSTSNIEVPNEVKFNESKSHSPSSPNQSFRYIKRVTTIQDMHKATKCLNSLTKFPLDLLSKEFPNSESTPKKRHKEEGILGNQTSNVNVNRQPTSPITKQG
jgi:hypothetical protein